MGAFLGMALAGGLGTAMNFGSSLFNYDMQRREQRWQRHFARNAAQIRAADLEAAGLSKTLAAGSAANAPPSISPQIGEPDVLGQMAAAAAIGKTKAETELANAMKDNKKTEGQYLGSILAETQTEKRLANELNSQLMNFRVKEGQAAAQSAHHRVNKDYYDAIAAKVGPELAQANLTRVQADALLKDATRAVQNVLEQEKTYNLKWYQTKGQEGGYPTNMGFDPFTRLIHMAAKQILEVLSNRYISTQSPGRGGTKDTGSLGGRADMSTAEPRPNMGADPWKAP